MNGTRTTECMLALLLMAWGWQMLLPGDYFQFPAYRFLGAIMTETRWGAAAIVVGLVRCLALGVNGWWRRTPVFRAICCLIGGLTWLAIGFLMYAAGERTGAFVPAGVIFYPVFFLFEGRCMIAIGADIQRTSALAIGGS